MSNKPVQHGTEKKRESKLSGVFSGIEPNIHLLHLSLLRQLSNKRAGTACTKTKSEVRGGGRKPWAQKGTGRARAGSSRSPLWVGGGIAFGPKPRSFEVDLPQKARNLSVAQAIVSKGEAVQILKKLPEIKDSKTKNLISTIKTMNIENKPVLFICDPSEPDFVNFNRASRNVPFITVKTENYLGVFEILKANTILITETALHKLDKRLSKFIHKKAKVVA